MNVTNWAEVPVLLDRILVQRIFGITDSTFSRWRKAGVFEGTEVRIGGCVRYRKEGIMALCETKEKSA